MFKLWFKRKNTDVPAPELDLTHQRPKAGV